MKQPVPLIMRDEIIEEVRNTRHAHAERFDYDLQRIVADLRRSEVRREEEGWRLLNPSGRSSRQD